METLKLIVEVIIGTLIGNIVARLCIKQPETKPRLVDNALTRTLANRAFQDIPEDMKKEFKRFVNDDNYIQDAVLLRSGVAPEDLDTMKKLLKDQVNKMK